MQFANYACSGVLKRLEGKPPTPKDIAMGIDGFPRLNQPIAIKQSDSVGMNAVDLFEHHWLKTVQRPE